MLPTLEPSRRFGSSVLAVSLQAALLATFGAGCNPQDVEEFLGDVHDSSATPAGTTVPFQEFSDDVGTHAATETRVLIRSAQGYQEYFGHAPPAGVSLGQEWVIFYAAGPKPSGGFDANVLSLIRQGKSLIAITELVSPGPSCIEPALVTTPNVLVKFAAQLGAEIQFNKRDRIADCGVSAVHCGGFGGFPCPGAGTCVDDPSDSCDPNNGGADCGGICRCDVKVACPQGQTFDSTPAVCACVPPTVTTVHCGGIAGIVCPGSGACVDDPSDSCDPKAGGADCGGICQCVQNVACRVGAAFDSSPAVCACVSPTPPVCGPVCDIFCQFGHVIDANGCPTCGCNPPPPPPPPPTCGPNCDIFCQFGHVIDANGCPTCACNPAPTPTPAR